jgi:hypothetical protein
MRGWDAKMNMPPGIDATEVYFIKLGRGGQWEEECLREGILRFGYDETSHADCEAGNWDAVLSNSSLPPYAAGLYSSDLPALAGLC